MPHTLVREHEVERQPEVLSPRWWYLIDPILDHFFNGINGDQKP